MHHQRHHTMARVFAAAGVLLLVAMAAVTEATTTNVQKSPPGTGSVCYKRLFKHESTDVTKCVEYLLNFEPPAGGSISPGIANTEREELRQRCCSTLKKVGPECMCMGIQVVLHHPLVSYLERVMDETSSMVLNLPVHCNLASEPCPMQAV